MRWEFCVILEQHQLDALLSDINELYMSQQASNLSGPLRQAAPNTQ